MSDYAGPLRDEPLALELHNTRYAEAGSIVDGLADASSMRAWLAAVAGRLPSGGAGPGPTPDELRELREPVREALHAVIDGRHPTRASLQAINDFRRRAVAVPLARWHPHAPPSLTLDVGAASRADVVLSALAADAIELLTGPDRDGIRICGAPGCVLAYLKRHPRREWCSSACGNRARQARHYARTRLA
jgi:predicted RNA-binding Zn ribbon-like protein